MNTSPYRKGAPGSRVYHALILELSGCTEEEVGGIEQVMRDRFRTLDNLNRAEFRKEARMARKVLHEIWKDAALK